MTGTDPSLEVWPGFRRNSDESQSRITKLRGGQLPGPIRRVLARKGVVRALRSTLRGEDAFGFRSWSLDLRNIGSPPRPHDRRPLRTRRVHHPSNAVHPLLKRRKRARRCRVGQARCRICRPNRRLKEHKRRRNRAATGTPTSPRGAGTTLRRTRGRSRPSPRTRGRRERRRGAHTLVSGGIEQENPAHSRVSRVSPRTRRSARPGRGRGA